MDHSENKKLVILFVDDEQIICQYFARICESYFEVLIAYDAIQAQQILKEKGEEISIVVSDNRMPKMNGIEFLTQVKKEYPNIIRILTTAYLDSKIESDSKNLAEVYKCIEKPWDIDNLLNDLRLAIESN